MREKDETRDKGVDQGLRHGNNDRGGTQIIKQSQTVLCPALLNQGNIWDWSYETSTMETGRSITSQGQKSGGQSTL